MAPASAGAKAAAKAPALVAAEPVVQASSGEADDDGSSGSGSGSDTLVVELSTASPRTSPEDPARAARLRQGAAAAGAAGLPAAAAATLPMEQDEQGLGVGASGSGVAGDAAEVGAAAAVGPAVPAGGKRAREWASGEGGNVEAGDGRRVLPRTDQSHAHVSSCEDGAAPVAAGSDQAQQQVDDRARAGTGTGHNEQTKAQTAAQPPQLRTLKRVHLAFSSAAAAAAPTPEAGWAAAQGEAHAHAARGCVDGTAAAQAAAGPAGGTQGGLAPARRPIVADHAGHQPEPPEPLQEPPAQPEAYQPQASQPPPGPAAQLPNSVQAPGAASDLLGQLHTLPPHMQQYVVSTLASLSSQLDNLRALVASHPHTHVAQLGNSARATLVPGSALLASGLTGGLPLSLLGGLGLAGGGGLAGWPGSAAGAGLAAARSGLVRWPNTVGPSSSMASIDMLAAEALVGLGLEQDEVAPAAAPAAAAGARGAGAGGSAAAARGARLGGMAVPESGWEVEAAMWPPAQEQAGGSRGPPAHQPTRSCRSLRHLAMTLPPVQAQGLQAVPAQQQQQQGQAAALRNGAPLCTSAEPGDVAPDGAAAATAAPAVAAATPEAAAGAEGPQGAEQCEVFQNAQANDAIANGVNGASGVGIGSRAAESMPGTETRASPDAAEAAGNPTSADAAARSHLGAPATDAPGPSAFGSQEKEEEEQGLACRRLMPLLSGQAAAQRALLSQAGLTRPTAAVLPRRRTPYWEGPAEELPPLEREAVRDLLLGNDADAVSPGDPESQDAAEAGARDDDLEDGSEVDEEAEAQRRAAGITAARVSGVAEASRRKRRRGSKPGSGLPLPIKVYVGRRPGPEDIGKERPYAEGYFDPQAYMRREPCVLHDGEMLLPTK